MRSMLISLWFLFTVFFFIYVLRYSLSFLLNDFESFNNFGLIHFFKGLSQMWNVILLANSTGANTFLFTILHNYIDSFHLICNVKHAETLLETIYISWYKILEYDIRYDYPAKYALSKDEKMRLLNVRVYKYKSFLCDSLDFLHTSHLIS